MFLQCVFSVSFSWNLLGLQSVLFSCVGVCPCPSTFLCFLQRRIKELHMCLLSSKDLDRTTVQCISHSGVWVEWIYALCVVIQFGNSSVEFCFLSRICKIIIYFLTVHSWKDSSSVFLKLFLRDSVCSLPKTFSGSTLICRLNTNENNKWISRGCEQGK